MNLADIRVLASDEIVERAWDRLIVEDKANVIDDPAAMMVAFAAFRAGWIECLTHQLRIGVRRAEAE